MLEKILGLREIGLRSCVLFALGYIDTENDWLLKHPKVRKSKEDFINILD